MKHMFCAVNHNLFTDSELLRACFVFSQVSAVTYFLQFLILINATTAYAKYLFFSYFLTRKLGFICPCVRLCACVPSRPFQIKEQRKNFRGNIFRKVRKWRPPKIVLHYFLTRQAMHWGTLVGTLLRGKAIRITYCECVFVAVVIQRMRHIVFCGLSGWTILLNIIS